MVYFTGLAWIFAAVVAFGSIMTPSWADDVSGAALVLDGDTLQIGGKRIRLFGIDAPETDQTCLDRSGIRTACGVTARDALNAYIANRPVTCRGQTQDRYGRLVATCTVGSDDIGRWLVRRGHALAYTQYSSDYIADQRYAEQSTTGLWSGTFVAPWEWRTRRTGTPLLGQQQSKAAARPILAAAATAPNQSCVIKGNVNARNERIYHMPGQRHYGQVNMNSANKRWFCSEDEARAAGWRKSAR